MKGKVMKKEIIKCSFCNKNILVANNEKNTTCPYCHQEFTKDNNDIKDMPLDSYPVRESFSFRKKKLDRKTFLLTIKTVQLLILLLVGFSAIRGIRKRAKDGIAPKSDVLSCYGRNVYDELNKVFGKGNLTYQNKGKNCEDLSIFYHKKGEKIIVKIVIIDNKLEYIIAGDDVYSYKDKYKD